MSMAKPASLRGLFRSRSLQRHRLAIAASLLVALGCAWVLRVGGLPVVPDRAAFAGVTWWALALHGVLYVAALYLRSHRWTWLLEPIEPVPLRRVVAVSFIGYGALVLMPFRTGEAVRPLLIRRRGLSAWAAAGTVAAERIIDGLFLSALLLAGLALARPREPLPDRIGDLAVPAAAVPRAAYLALAVFGAAFVAIGVFYFRRAWARRATERVVGLVSTKLAGRLADAVERVASGLGFLPRLRYTAPFLLATAGYFLLNVWAMQIVAFGCGLLPIDFPRAAVLVGVLHLGVLLPNAPGYFGTFQMAVYAGLSLYLAPEVVMGPGSALVFSTYSLQVGLVVLLGAIALAVEGAPLSQAFAENQAEDVRPQGLPSPPGAS
ncbi:lysylphosphatidylglycerol synthase domain-containing protein [Sorangium sp. So ce302]|uniref:lysylphosphatidylglycerol synthase transmembrane domain-containing protein n=1 Tax=Sorangium sp. So ce302 TaxID=3133297 RepID=UPI003F6124FA